jgi:protein mago nashi
MACQSMREREARGSIKAHRAAMSSPDGDNRQESSTTASTNESVAAGAGTSPSSPTSNEGGVGSVDEFYLRYYLGHRGRFGHEFMEFEVYPGGKLRYCNSSNYKNGEMIRRECFVSPAVVEEVKRMVVTSNIVSANDTTWPEPASDNNHDAAAASQDSGRQELECKIGKHHIAFTTRQIGSITDIERSSDPDGLRTFFHLTQDLKELVLALISFHFKARPI